MRHNVKKGLKLGTDASHTKAMKKSLAKALFENDRIKTTETRAKALRSVVDPIITWAKKGDLHSRRLAIAKLGDKQLVAEISTSVPTIVRTIECRNALPSMVNVRMSSPNATSWPNSARITQRCVGLPTAEATLQKLLKSCSPKSAGQAADMASTSKG